MARRPEGNLGDMAISKSAAASAAPFSRTTTTPEPAPVISASKSLTVKLDGETYAMLRDYCHRQERATGKRLTHQEVMVQAAKDFLNEKDRG